MLASSCAVIGSLWFVMMRVGMRSPFSKPLTFRWAFLRMCARPSCVRVVGLLIWKSHCNDFLHSGYELLCLHFSCLRPPHLASCGCTCAWLSGGLICWAVLFPHTEGSMVGDNDTNPLPGPGSLITPCLLRSFHAILTFVTSSCWD